MMRWDIEEMEAIGRKLFAKIHRQKHRAHHNHDVHFLAREINEWLPQGIQSMIDGTYISVIYLKPLDDVFNEPNVDYLG